MMKKTLVALAAVAATGGAFAQATMTGAIGYGYAAGTDSAGATTSGIGVADAQINFAITEDLGNGMSLSGAMGLNAYGQGATAGANDMNIRVKTASGLTVNFSANKSGHYLGGGNAGAGAAFEAGLDGKVLSARSASESITISMPLMEGLTGSVSHTEPTQAGAYGTGAASATKQRYNTVALSYKAGALAADVQYRSYDLQVADTETSASTKNRASVSYDLGMMKIGAGMDTTNYTAGNSYSESLVGLTVPFGNLTLGAQLAQMSTTGYSTNYSNSGSLMGLSYSLSKRTYVTAQYYSYTGGFTGSTLVDTAGTQNYTGTVFSIYNSF